MSKSQRLGNYIPTKTKSHNFNFSNKQLLNWTHYEWTKFNDVISARKKFCGMRWSQQPQAIKRPKWWTRRKRWKQPKQIQRHGNQQNIQGYLHMSLQHKLLQCVTEDNAKFQTSFYNYTIHRDKAEMRWNVSFWFQLRLVKAKL